MFPWLLSGSLGQCTLFKCGFEAQAPGLKAPVQTDEACRAAPERRTLLWAGFAPGAVPARLCCSCPARRAAPSAVHVAG